jgi:hypothetical protein
MKKTFLYTTLIFFINASSLFAQDEDDNLNGGPPQVSIDEAIPLFVLLTIAVVFVYMYRKNKMILINSTK